MEKYELFDEYLKKSKAIRQFCERKENLLFDAIRLDASTDSIINYLNAIGSDIDKVITYIEELKKQSKLPQSFWELSC